MRWTVQDGVIYILDLRRDVYLSVPAPGWPAQAGQLDERGLFSQERAPAEKPPAAQQRGALAIVFALLWARRILRQRKLEAALQLFGDAPGANDDKLEGLIARFAGMRAFYPRPISCLFDALALGRFLLGAGVRSDLVFGVRARPFAAHAWLEKQGRVINDDPDYCAAFARLRGNV